MKFIVDNWLLIAVALASGGLLIWPAIGRGGAGALSPTQAVQLINREKAVVVDVCEPAEFAGGHVTGAKNLPLAQLAERLPDAVKNKSVPLIMVCARGARAQSAMAIAKKLGYEQAQVLAGGMAAWKEANLPVERG